MKRRDWLVLGMFLAFTLALRAPAFWRSVLDWDETVFLLMGRAILRGEVPYTTVWEHSPIGQGILFAAAQWLLGQTVVSIRILTWVTVAIESFLLYRLGTLWGGTGITTGLVAGVIYAVYSLTNNGLAAHREFFFAPLTTLSVYLLASWRGNAAAGQVLRIPNGRLAAIGLLMGIGLQLKYLYAGDVLAILLIVAIELLPVPRTAVRAWTANAGRTYALLAGGLILLFPLTWLYFGANGQLQNYARANFLAATTYVVQGSRSLGLFARQLIRQVNASPLAWFGLFLAPIRVALVKDLGDREHRAFLWLAVWFISALVAVSFTGRFFPHYFLQLLPPLSLIAALVVTGLLRDGAFPGLARRALLLTLILAVPLFPVAYPRLAETFGALWHHYVNGREFAVDTAGHVAAYLRAHLPPGDVIYVADYEPILYYLVDTRMPTRYVFPLHLIDEGMEGAVGIDQVAELGAIMAQRPVYVIRRQPPSTGMTNQAYAAHLDEYLGRSYALEHVIQGNDTTSQAPIEVELYRLRGTETP